MAPNFETREIVATATKRKNYAVAFFAFTGALMTFMFPLYISKKHETEGKSLYAKDQSLTGSQIIRGAFINSGSKDMGADPDWDHDKHEWKGRRRT